MGGVESAIVAERSVNSILAIAHVQEQKAEKRDEGRQVEKDRGENVNVNMPLGTCVTATKLDEGRQGKKDGRENAENLSMVTI